MFLIVTNLAVYIMETFLLKVNKPMQCFLKFPMRSFAFALMLSPLPSHFCFLFVSDSLSHFLVPSHLCQYFNNFCI